jgi:hypothetical protein
MHVRVVAAGEPDHDLTWFRHPVLEIRISSREREESPLDG